MAVFTNKVKDGRMQNFHGMKCFTVFYSLCDVLSYILKWKLLQQFKIRPDIAEKLYAIVSETHEHMFKFEGFFFL